jgi:segregation and condensation protein A
MEYSFKIEQFEGPLDLLLHLIRKSKINIEEIFVSKITEQYLAYVNELDDVDMDRTSDFLNMAATLVYIKSRRLVPVHEEEEEEEIDPELELIERLKAYKIFKEASEKMKGIEKQAAGRFYKLPLEYPFEVDDFSIEGATVEKLYKAFSKLMKKIALREVEKSYVEVALEKDPVTVRQQKKYIRKILEEKGKISFDMLFEDVSSRLQVAVTFLALLELLHINYLVAEQKGSLDIILISKVSK